MLLDRRTMLTVSWENHLDKVFEWRRNIVMMGCRGEQCGSKSQLFSVNYWNWLTYLKSLMKLIFVSYTLYSPLCQAAGFARSLSCFKFSSLVGQTKVVNRCPMKNWQLPTWWSTDDSSNHLPCVFKGGSFFPTVSRMTYKDDRTIWPFRLFYHSKVLERQSIVCSYLSQITI